MLFNCCLILICNSCFFLRKCLRVMSGVLGISISSEGELSLGAGKIYVANHITSYDHFVIHLTTNAIMVIRQLIR